MLNINIQLFGGRGANSGFGGSFNTGGSPSRVSAFYDKTDKFKGMTLHEFENAVRDKKYEYMAGYNDKGELVVAGTSQNKGAVAIPTNHPRWNEVTTLTHNHPYSDGRGIGGSFSGADVQNHLRLGLKGETRAVSNGHNENTYIFRGKKGAKQNSSGMLKVANQFDTRYASHAAKTSKQVSDRLAKKGKTIGSKSGEVFIGAAKHVWRNTRMDRFGYEYIEINKKRW